MKLVMRLSDMGLPYTSEIKSMKPNYPAKEEWIETIQHDESASTLKRRGEEENYDFHPSIVASKFDF